MNIKQLATVGVLLVAAGSAMADITNVRPVATAGNTLDSLQDIFTGIGSTIDARTDQLSAAYFNNQSTGANATYVASMSWNAGAFPFDFGLYEMGDITNTVKIFRDQTQGTGQSDPGDFTSILFNQIGGTVSTWYTDALSGSTTLLDSTNNYIDTFGFYFSWVDSNNVTNIYYGDDDLNANGAAAMLAYEAKGDNVNIAGQTGNDANHLYVAMEGYGGNYDFNDVVVQLESIVPVSAPATLALLGLGLLGMARAASRRKA